MIILFHFTSSLRKDTISNLFDPMNLSLSRVYVNFKCGHNMQIPFAFHVMSSLGKKHQYHWSSDLEKRHLSLCREQSWPCRLVQHLCSTEQPVHVTRPMSLQVTLDPITTQPRRKMPDNYKFCFNPLYPDEYLKWEKVKNEPGPLAFLWIYPVVVFLP